MRALILAVSSLVLALPVMAGTVTRPRGGTGTRPSRGTGARPGRGTAPKSGRSTGARPKRGTGTKRGASPAGGPAGGDPDAEAEAEAEPPKPAVRVEKSSDVVILTDGTKLVGTIIAVGGKRLLLIEEGAKTDRAIDRSEVESFRRGSSERKTVGYDVKKDTEKGVLVLAEQGEADPTTTPAPDSRLKPKPKPKPGPGPKPKPKPKPAPARLDKLWGLLEGNPSAAQIGAAFRKNSKWKGQVDKLIKGKKVPAKGQKAFNKLKQRVRTDKAFRDGLADLIRKDTLPLSVLEILTAK